LNERPTTDKLILGKRYRVKIWLVAGYTTLVTQDQLDLNQLAASSIDWPTISRLFSIRETVVRKKFENLSQRCGWCGNTGYMSAVSVPTDSAPLDVEGLIARDFALELGDC